MSFWQDCWWAGSAAAILRKDGWTVALALILLSSLVFGVVGVLIGEQWSTLAENIRIGTGHLSYRLDRLPWARHRFGFFALCVALFWCTGAVRYKMRRQSPLLGGTAEGLESGGPNGI